MYKQHFVAWGETGSGVEMLGKGHKFVKPGTYTGGGVCAYLFMCIHGYGHAFLDVVMYES